MIEAIHPDEFISELISLDPQAVADADESCRQRLRNLAKSVDEFLEILLRQGLTRSLKTLRSTEARQWTYDRIIAYGVGNGAPDPTESCSVKAS
jgi:hypothetical protein